jgi:hypothetical protein
VSKDALPPPQTIPAACPHCGASVKPIKVTTSKETTDRVDVTMVCKDCNHTWIVQKLTDDERPM